MNERLAGEEPRGRGRRRLGGGAPENNRRSDARQEGAPGRPEKE